MFKRSLKKLCTGAKCSILAASAIVTTTLTTKAAVVELDFHSDQLGGVVEGQLNGLLWPFNPYHKDDDSRYYKSLARTDIRPKLDKLDALLEPLKINHIRIGMGHDFATYYYDTYIKGRDYLDDVTLIISSSYNFYPAWWSGHKAPPWEDWTIYEDYLREHLSKTKDIPLDVIYDVWNEPDGGHYFTDWLGENYTEEDLINRFNEVYERTYALIREIHPEAKIAAPGYFGLKKSRFDGFYDFVVEKGIVPDIYDFHFLIDQAYGTPISDQVAYLREVEAERPVYVTEYGLRRRVEFPGGLAYDMAKLQNAEPDYGVFACWINRDTINYGNFGGLLGKKDLDDAEEDFYTRGNYWAFHAYVLHDGPRAQSLTTNDAVAALGSIDDSGKIRILLGNNKNDASWESQREDLERKVPKGGYEGPTNIILRGLKAAESESSESVVSAKLYRIPFNNAGRVDKPVHVYTKEVSLNESGTLILPELDWTNGFDAYAFEIMGVESI